MMGYAGTEPGANACSIALVGRRPRLRSGEEQKKRARRSDVFAPSKLAATILPSMPGVRLY